MDNYPPKVQRPALEALAASLDSRSSALRRDECGDWSINGKRGHIYAVPEGYQLCYITRYGVNEWDGDGPHVEDYFGAKRRLIFCRLAQDGTGEGIFFLDRLPTEAEAEVIRDVFEILRRKHYTEEQLAVMRERGQALAKTRVAEASTAEMASGGVMAAESVSSLSVPHGAA